MTHSIKRRDFLMTAGALGAGLGLSTSLCSRLLAADAPKGTPNAEKLGWRLAVQAYSFNRYTFFEAVDMTVAAGLRYIEIFPGQQISKTIHAKMDASMTPDMRKEVLKKLSDSGVKALSFGVGASDRKHFEFAKEMGLETLVAEPNENAFDEIDKLCVEYDINVAIHNHPRPSHYWNPDTVLKVCKGRSKRIGSCADTGHWARCGLKPLDCIKKLKGRIISFHFKDLNQMGPRAHDVPWGTGVCDVKGMLAEIHRQGLKAEFAIEYEYHWENSVPDMILCAAYFDKIAAELAAKS
jgi:sugar phosphate isomerase/epimerase